MTCIHRDNVTPQLIMIVLTNGRRDYMLNLQAFTLVEPLDVVRLRMCHSLEIELLHDAKLSCARTTLTINDQGAQFALDVHLEWKMFSLCSSLAPLRPL